MYYKTFSIDELDCILFQRSLNHTIDAVETSINELYTTLVGLSDFDSNCWQNNFFDLSTQLDFIQVISFEKNKDLKKIEKVFNFFSF